VASGVRNGCDATYGPTGVRACPLEEEPRTSEPLSGVLRFAEGRALTAIINNVPRAGSGVSRKVRLVTLSSIATSLVCGLCGSDR
jgi:hypothetical protein